MKAPTLHGEDDHQGDDGEHLTRAELAEMVNTWLWEHTGRRFELDDHLIGKWERGVVRYPIAPYRAALRTVLDVDTDAALGFTPPRSTTPTGAADATSGEWTLGAIANDAAHVTEWELINRRDALRGAAAVVGGAALLSPLAQWVEPLIDAQVVRTPPPSSLSVRAGAFSVVEVEALEHLVVAFRGWRSTGAGLQIVHLAQRGTRTTATPRLRAMLATREAWAHAQLGDVRRFLHAVETAEESHSDGDTASEPRWLTGLDTAELLGTIGARYRDLARHDPRKATGAVAYLSRALDMRDPDRARNRAFDLVSLGRAHLITGEPDRAAAAVESALLHVDPQRPGRLHRKLSEWHTEAAVFAAVPVIAETREHVREAVRVSGSATA